MTTPRPVPAELSFGLGGDRNRQADHELPSRATLEATAAIGCDRVQLTLRWDDRATLERAVAVDRDLCDLGLEPVIALDGGAGGWWVALDAPQRFQAWAEEVVDRFPRARAWIPIIQPNVGALRSHITWRHPATGHLLRALDHQLAAHVLAAEVIHGRIPVASVVCSLASDVIYELDGLLLDVLLAPAAGIPRAEIGDFLRQRRSLHYRSLERHPAPRRRLVLRRLARSVIPLEQALPRAIAAAYSCDDRPVDRVRRDTPVHFRPAVRLPLELDLDTDAGVEAARVTVRCDPSISTVWRPTADGTFRELITALRGDMGVARKPTQSAR